MTDKEIQTVNNLNVDTGVQTSSELLEKYVGDIFLDGLSTEISSRLTTDFVERYRNNPEYADYFNIDSVNNWITQIETSTTNSVSSELNFLLQLREELRTLSRASSNSIQSISNNINDIPITDVKQVTNSISLNNLQLVTDINSGFDISQITDATQLGTIITSFCLICSKFMPNF
jgi:hypothetical protein